ncbi:LRP2-binding protein isoform X1 [Pangasianodon hypophthalmus]|uniref:LRP2-binding protein isoform X1 n=1 Tax=Pangasianodon hypophthalmus TaxID=310915 RepID=UPI0023072046|nr:LRP2-binding protein isoform X1 [Pangasianodon hypophthalmus]
MDSSDQMAHRIENLQKIRTAKVLKAVLSVYENHEAFKCDGNSAECLVEKAEKLLKSKAEAGDTQASLLLGHLYYEEGNYTEAEAVFDGIKDREPEALYQLAVMYYDGLTTTADPSKAVDYMRRVAERDTGSVRYAALYNLGRAYLHGFGVQASREEAEKYWLIAADDGNPNASVEAQSSLGLFYSSPEIRDLKRAFYWHSEACGNGSLESQGALGIMYLYGYGVSKDLKAARYCLTEAAARGSVYAQGHLAAYYYQRKLYTRAALLAKRVCKYEDVSAIATFTGCDPEYICKGIAIGLFYYARCLQLGRGVAQNTEKAQHYYTKAALMNPEVFKDLQMDLIYCRM